MANLFQRSLNAATIIGRFSATSSLTLQFNSQYTFGSAGAAASFRFCSPATSTLDHAWVFVSATAGTGNTITGELRAYTSGGTTPGSIITNGTATVASGTSSSVWKKIQWSTPPSIVAGTYYHLVLANAASDAATNNFTLQTRNIVSGGPVDVGATMCDYLSSANGFSTATNQSAIPPVVLVFGDGTVLGGSYTSSNNSFFTNNTRERGLYWSGGPVEQLQICGAAWQASSAFTTLNIYSGSTAPGGTKLLNLSLDQGSIDQGMTFFPAVTLAKATDVRITLTPNANSQRPGVYTVGNSGASAELANAMFCNGNFQATIDNGSGGWTNTTDSTAMVALIVHDQVAVGGGNLVGRSALVG